MVKDDTRDQIPLFELPSTEKSPDSSRTETAGSGKTVPEQPAPEQKNAPKTSRLKLPPKDTKKQPGTRIAAGKGRNMKGVPGPVPEGDVRLTANIREDLHLKLKIIAATRRTTIGELIEELVEHNLK